MSWARMVKRTSKIIFTRVEKVVGNRGELCGIYNSHNLWVGVKMGYWNEDLGGNVQRHRLRRLHRR
jgi:hypothetical protein